jgi:hypothetical protein
VIPGIVGGISMYYSLSLSIFSSSLFFYFLPFPLNILMDIVILVDGRSIAEYGFFQGYNIWTFGAISCQAVGGLIVAVVVKVLLFF